MKKSIILMFSLLILLTGCNSYSTISLNDVESATIWIHESQRDMTEDEVSKVLEQYNSSEYGGKSTGEGGTPDFGISISLNDGKEIFINDFYGKVEVSAGNKFFYLENTELYELIKQLSGFSYDKFNETERQRYDTVKGDPLCSGFNDNVEFSQDLSAEKSVTLNGTDRTLSYYFSSINLGNNDIWVNPDNIDISTSRDIYTDSDHNLYMFDSDYGTFEIYRSNSWYNSDESDNEGQLTTEQAVNIVIDFIKDLTTEDVYQDPEVTPHESGLFVVRFENSDEYFKKSSLVAHVSRSGVVKSISTVIHQNDSVTVDQIEATDEKLEAYINEHYKNFSSYTLSRMIDIVKGTPAIFYSVTFTETYGTNKANYVEIIVLKIDD